MISTSTRNYIDDEYDHSDSALEYVLENVLSQAALNGDDLESRELCEAYNSVLIYCCDCLKNCSDSRTCRHGGNYVLNESVDPPELILRKEVKKDIFYECCDGCKCRTVECLNRLVQRGPRKHLKIIDSVILKSKGLATTVDIPCGAFICEYAGELLTPNEAQFRAINNEKSCRMNYIICLNELRKDELSNVHRKTFVDPSQRGNIGRYLNHSCNPNCEIFIIRVDCPIPKICIFSKRDIRAGEELCFHYGGGETIDDDANDSNQRVACLCKSENCSNFLPNIHF